jgi:hypothetical protein
MRKGNAQPLSEMVVEDEDAIYNGSYFFITFID